MHTKCADGMQVTVRQDAAAPIPEEGAAVGLDWDRIHEMRFDDTGRRI
jgi:sn-glycerol 3-phosphate transport system ATP-binding protein